MSQLDFGLWLDFYYVGGFSCTLGELMVNIQSMENISFKR